MKLDFENDISIALATSAHRGTSHTPERRGEQEIAGYAAQLRADYQLFSDRVSDENRAAFEDAFQAYRLGFAAKFRAYLAAKSRRVSTMIAGPSNFNTRRAQKSSDTADKRGVELAEYRARALRSLRAIVFPNEAPVASGDTDAVERLRAKLAEAEKFQAFAKKINGAIRAAVRGNYNPITALIAIGFTEKQATEFVAPDPLGRVGVPDYRLKNNSAEIRRLKARIASVEAAQARPDVEDYHVTTEIALVVSTRDNRVRLKFPGKPDARTRAQLKTNGFRWAPSVAGGVWQSYANPTAIAYAQGIASNGAFGYEP